MVKLKSTIIDFNNLKSNFNINIDINEIDNHIEILQQCIENQIQLDSTSVSNEYEPVLLKFVKRWRISKYQNELDFWNQLKQDRLNNDICKK